MVGATVVENSWRMLDGLRPCSLFMANAALYAFAALLAMCSCTAALCP